MSAPESVARYEPEERWHLRRGYIYLTMLWLVIPCLALMPSEALYRAALTGSSGTRGDVALGTAWVLVALALAALCGALAVREAYRVRADGPVPHDPWRWLGLVGWVAGWLTVVLIVPLIEPLTGSPALPERADSAGLAAWSLLLLGAVVIGTTSVAISRLERAVRYGAFD